MQITHSYEAREIRLRCVFARQFSTELRPFRCHHGMDEWDRHKEVQFHFVHDGRRYVMTGASVQDASLRFAGPPQEGPFIRSDEHGKPEILIGDPLAKRPVSLSTSRPKRRSFECWMLMAAYMKTAGGAFSVALHSFSFYLPRPDSQGLLAQSCSDDVPACWRSWQFSMGSRHAISPCCEGPRSEAPRLVLREVVPSF